MPQMSPIYWLLLLLYFIFALMMLMLFIYFFFYNSPSMKSLYMKENTYNWLW
uniref:ATP synthase complex subunit 8 n=1 Tax=Pomponia linearis TaxID=1195093 RepID=A0A343KGP1_9HEMI|nr:ATP synthase F0 subunit 8 [Pomponia linearis]